MKGRNAKGCAVDLGFTAQRPRQAHPEQRRRKLVAFQLAEYRYAKRLRFRTFEELLGPQTDIVLLLAGKRTDLVNGSPLEIQHRQHVHVSASWPSRMSGLSCQTARRSSTVSSMRSTGRIYLSFHIGRASINEEVP
jgi:hypothetical protein